MLLFNSFFVKEETTRFCKFIHLIKPESMEKILIEAIYELTQAIEVLAVKVDELDETTNRLLLQNKEINNLPRKQKPAA
jgi:hypothetical protein